MCIVYRYRLLAARTLVSACPTAGAARRQIRAASQAFAIAARLYRLRSRTASNLFYHSLDFYKQTPSCCWLQASAGCSNILYTTASLHLYCAV